METCYLPVATFSHKDGWKDYAGQVASIEANGHNSLPWSIVLHNPMRLLANCGSMATAWATFKQMELVSYKG